MRQPLKEAGPGGGGPAWTLRKAQVRATEIWPPDSSPEVVAKWQRPGLGNISSGSTWVDWSATISSLGLCYLEYNRTMPPLPRVSPHWQSPHPHQSPTPCPPRRATQVGHPYPRISLLSSTCVSIIPSSRSHPGPTSPRYSPPGNGSQSAHPSTALTTGCAHLMPAVWWQKSWIKPGLLAFHVTHDTFMNHEHGPGVAWASHVSVSHLHMGARRVPISTRLWKNYRRQRM